MEKLIYRTKSANEDIIRKDWVLIDADGEVLGRLASKAAKILRGKNKVYYTPHRDCGDHVIIINAEKVRLTGMKWTDKQYIHHTGGGGDPWHVAQESPGASDFPQLACLCRPGTSSPGTESYSNQD